MTTKSKIKVSGRVKAKNKLKEAFLENELNAVFTAILLLREEARKKRGEL